MRTITPLALVVALAGCGSVCDQAAAAERGANAKSLDCTLTNLTVHDANKCNMGLQKCNSDDLAEINSYVSCLNGLPGCSPSNEIQFRTQRDGCSLQALTRISFTCQANIL